MPMPEFVAERVHNKWAIDRAQMPELMKIEKKNDKNNWALSIEH